MKDTRATKARAQRQRAEEPADPRVGVRRKPRTLANTDEGANRTRILEAALKTFSLEGFAGASIADIARQHRVSPALIHYYFATKEDLWHAALEFGIGDVLRNLHETMDDLSEIDSVSRLKFFIRRYIAIVAERPEVFRVIIRESETRGPRLTWLTKHHLAPLYGLFTELVEAAQSEGKIKSVVPSYHLSQIIAGASYQFIASRNRMLEAYGIDVLSRDVRDRHATAVLDVLFNGMLTEQAAEADQLTTLPAATA
jgi:TetR/AcrR family transcriptional regulator